MASLVFIVNIKINFKTDEPNLNGLIYSSEVLNASMTKALQSDLILYHSAVDNGYDIPDISDAIGLVKSYRNDCDNNLSIDVQMFNNRFAEFIEELLEKELLQATIAGRGRVSGNEIIDYEIMYMFLTTDMI